MATYTSDTFTDANGTTLATHMPDTGTAYDAESGGELIESNALTNGSFSIAFMRANPPPAAADYKATADISVNGGSEDTGMALMLRNQGAGTGNWYMAGYDSSIPGWFIALVASASITNLDTSGSLLMSAPQTRHMEFECVGSVLTLTVDSTLLLTVIDTTYSTTGQGGIYSNSLLQSDWSLDNFTVEDGGGGGGGVHTLSGRGTDTLATPSWLSIAISGRPGNLSNGAAEPPNYYHVGMISWGSDNGAMTAYPVTRDLDLVQLPAGMTTLWYEFATGVTAVITELATP